MSDLNLYWAEEALGEPYAPQDYRWLKSTRRVGLLLGGATCVLTASAILGGAVYYLVDRPPHVAISSYEHEVVAQASPQLSPPPAAASERIPAAPAARAESSAQARTSTKEPAPRAANATGKAVAPTPAAAPTEVKIKAASTPTKARPDAVVATQEKALPGKVAESSKPAVSPTQAQAKAIPVAAPTTPPAKPEPDTRTGISKSAESKPTDIASGEKLGIREILADGIVMHNGRKVKNGTALPNGEILMGTDAGKGMAETDRRVLVLTP